MPSRDMKIEYETKGAEMKVAIGKEQQGEEWKANVFLTRAQRLKKKQEHVNA